MSNRRTLLNLAWLTAFLAAAAVVYRFRPVRNFPPGGTYLHAQQPPPTEDGEARKLIGNEPKPFFSMEIAPLPPSESTSPAATPSPSGTPPPSASAAASPAATPASTVAVVAAVVAGSGATPPRTNASWAPEQRPLPATDERSLTSHRFQEVTIHSENPPSLPGGGADAAVVAELSSRLVIAIGCGVHSGFQVIAPENVGGLKIVGTLLRTFLPTAQPHHLYRWGRS